MVYRLIKALSSTRSLISIAVVAASILAIIGIIQPLGEALDDDACVL